MQRTDFGRARPTYELGRRSRATSIRWAANERARSPRPMIDLYRPIAVSARERFVTGRGLPLHPAIGVDQGERLVSLICGIVALTVHRIGAGRDNHRRVGAVPGKGIVGWLTIIGSIGRQLRDRHVDRVEQRLQRDLTPCLSSIHWPAQ
jgi:hypothetical protein